MTNFTQYNGRTLILHSTSGIYTKTKNKKQIFYFIFIKKSANKGRVSWFRAFDRRKNALLPRLRSNSHRHIMFVSVPCRTPTTTVFYLWTWFSSSHSQINLRHYLLLSSRWHTQISTNNNHHQASDSSPPSHVSSRHYASSKPGRR